MEACRAVRRTNPSVTNPATSALPEPIANVHLTRKLSFASQSKQAVTTDSGLPTLLKQLRDTAQREVDLATSHVTQLHVCLASEIHMMEVEAHLALMARERKEGELRCEVGDLHVAHGQLQERHRALEATNAALVCR